MQSLPSMMRRTLPLLALLVGAPSFADAQKSGPPVRMLEESTLSSLVKDRNGRGLVVNVWATWCLPCVEEFPDIVRLDSMYRSRGVDVVTISIDFDDEVDTKIRPFLQRVRATMPSYVNAFPTPSELIEAMDPSWSGAIPATFVYGRTGSRIEYVVGRQSFDSLKKLAEKALHTTSR